MPLSLYDLWNWAVRETTPLLVYQMTVSVFVVFSLINAIADGFAFRRPSSGPALSPGPLPSLSVLIPARNEEAVIADCVRSLLDAGYPGPLEILVLDDRSEDRTGEIVAALAAGDSRVRLLRGGELLPGWKGKPNALRQLAEAATGDLLLLTDADCRFYPGSLEASVRHRERTGADCLSLMPYLICESFWEHIVIPLQYFLVFTTLPIRNVYASPNPAFAAANGAFILLPADTYGRLGGHGAVRGEMAEDIKFAQHVKKSGMRLVYADGSHTYAVRMYESLSGIWEGFSKNMFPAMGRSLAVLSVWLLFQVTTQILPSLWVVLALFNGDRSPAGFVLPLFHLFVGLSIRLALSVRFRQAVWATLTHPVGWCIVCAIAVRSAYLSLSGKGHTWKGRIYTS
ncbi:MAG: glycosyltransferase [Capsulimonadales bacterium]|nr:glycosyltransferase [Capsulimonadales bacterium]